MVSRVQESDASNAWYVLNFTGPPYVEFLWVADNIVQSVFLWHIHSMYI